MHKIMVGIAVSSAVCIAVSSAVCIAVSSAVCIAVSIAVCNVVGIAGFQTNDIMINSQKKNTSTIRMVHNTSYAGLYFIKL